MIPQTDRRCKPFLAKKRPGREKAHGVSSRPGVRTARPVQTPSGKLSAVVWAAGAGFMQGAVLWGAPQGRRRRRRAGAARRSPRSGPPAGRGYGGFMVGPDGAGRAPGGRPGRRPGTGAAWGRPHAAAGGGPPSGWCGGYAWARAGRVRGWGSGSGPRRGPPAGRAEAGRSPAAGAAGAGLRGHPASAERRMVIAEVVRRPPGHGRCRRWPAGFWCAGGGHWGPCPAHRGPPPPHGRPSWKGS